MTTLVLMVQAQAATAPKTNVMRENLTTVFALQEYLASPSQFRDPANAQIITASIDSLSRLPHQFDENTAEPTVAAVAKLFGDRLALAKENFRNRRLDLARQELKGLTTLCLSCHTRMPGMGLPEAKVPKELTGLERANFLVAVREFDAALEQWKQLLETAAGNPLAAYEQTSALRGAVALAVRVKDDPKLTLKLLESVKLGADAPSTLHRYLPTWKQDANAWSAEKFVSVSQSPDALFARGRKLVESSNAAKSLTPEDADLVKLSRAVSYLNQALLKAPQAKWHAEALYWLALATSGVMDSEWTLVDGLFLEACIRRSPHTKLSARCFERLTERTVYQYSLLGETTLPGGLGGRLAELQTMAR